ncbi:MAG: helical backbone metal receptor, partial [Myxococcota bacterium]
LPSRALGRALYLIWRGPWMAAGRETFIHSVMDACGFENVVEDSRYPEVSADAILRLAPARILLSSEPFPFRDTHRAELQELLPGASIEYVDGEIFSWYGSRMRHIAAYARELTPVL